MRHLAAAGMLLALASSCLATRPLARTLVDDVEQPSAMTVSDGELLWAELRSGRISALDLDGDTEPRTLARLPVATEGQRGLLGLAAGRRRYASWVRPDGRLVVGRPDGELVWEGPETSDLGNGGRIAFAPDGSLVIGIGDLREPDRVDDPEAPNGKLLRLDPDGPPGQDPEVVSSGWNNPFAFAFGPGGALWVADNSPGERPERIARGEGPRPSDVTELDHKHAPSGLAVLPSGDLVMCGYVSRELRRFDVVEGRARPGELLADDCALGVVLLPDGRLAYATADAIRTVRP